MTVVIGNIELLRRRTKPILYIRRFCFQNPRQQQLRAAIEFSGAEHTSFDSLKQHRLDIPGIIIGEKIDPFGTAVRLLQVVISCADHFFL